MKKILPFIAIIFLQNIIFSQNTYKYFGVATGVNNYTVVINAINTQSPSDGDMILVRFQSSNTGAATIMVKGIGAINYGVIDIEDKAGAAISTGMILGGTSLYLAFNKIFNSWQVIGDGGTGGGGGGGEINTASNTGSVGVGLFKQKSGVNLEFYKINPLNNKVSITQNGTDRIDIGVVEGNFTSIPQSAVINLSTDLSNKQNTLVSGTNIKTVNSTSLLGAGNVAVEPVVTSGATSQYYRGDKSWQTLDKSAVGLSNVDNTSDINKPVSTAQQTAINAKVADAIVDGVTTVAPSQNAVFDALALKQNNLSLTTTGTSGAATLVGSTLNIPQYTGGGGGGGLTSVGIAAGKGISVAGSPLTANGTMTVSNTYSAIKHINGVEFQGVDLIVTGNDTNKYIRPQLDSIEANAFNGNIISPGSGVLNLNGNNFAVPKNNTSEWAEHLDGGMPNEIPFQNATGQTSFFKCPNGQVATWVAGVLTCTTVSGGGGGLTSLNAQTGGTQTFATGTAGTDFAISSASNAHTFNLPTASASNRGLLSSANWSTFNGKMDVPSGSTGTILRHNGTSYVATTATYPNTITTGKLLYGSATNVVGETGNLFWDNTNSRLGIGNSSPSYKFDVIGLGVVARFNATNGNQNMIALSSSSDGTPQCYFGTAGSNVFTVTNSATTELFRINNTGLGIGTTTPQNKLDVEGGVAIGATYSGTNTAPTNGLIVEGNVGIGQSSATSKLNVVSSNVGASGGTAISAITNNNVSATENNGITSTCSTTGGITNNGVYSAAGGANYNYSVRAISQNPAIENYGVYGSAQSATTNYGVRGYAFGGTTGYGGYFVSESATNNYALVTNGGRVGIGTITPTELFQVVGTGTVSIQSNGKIKQQGLHLFNQNIDVVDDGFIDLPSGAWGYGTVMAAHSSNALDGFISFRFNGDGVVTEMQAPDAWNRDIADTDTKLCVFDNGSNVRIKNRTGGTVTLMFNIYHN